MHLDRSELRGIVERVQARLGQPASAPGLPPSGMAAYHRSAAGGDGIFATVDEAVAHALAAYGVYRDVDLTGRREIIAAMRAAALREARPLAEAAHSETGLGRIEDKVIKNQLTARVTPGVEDLAAEVVTSRAGTVISDFAPFGVIGSITPTTNPTSTIINNAIAMLAAGNAVVFNVHPAAKGCSIQTVRILNAAVQGAGGPPHLITCVAEPTMDTAKALMTHADVNVLVVTGGPGVVQAALATNKKAITAGPGNPPAVVDETADIDRAARDIVFGASFDNNVICVDEKTTIVVASVADALLAAMERHKALRLSQRQLGQLEKVIFKDPANLRPGARNPLNGDWIGKHAGTILAQIGVEAEPDLRLAVVEVGNDHPLVWSEQMMPVMPVTRVPDFEAAVALAKASEHGYRHTASIHSRDIDRITRMGRAMNCSLFIANGSNLAGLGAQMEGFTSFTIASPTGEGLSRPRTFARMRRTSLVGSLGVI